MYIVFCCDRCGGICLNKFLKECHHIEGMCYVFFSSIVYILQPHFNCSQRIYRMPQFSWSLRMSSTCEKSSKASRNPKLTFFCACLICFKDKFSVTLCLDESKTFLLLAWVVAFLHIFWWRAWEVRYNSKIQILFFFF